MMTDSILIRSLSTCCRYIPSHFLPLPFKFEGGKKDKPWDWASPKNFAGQNHHAHQSRCFPTRKLWWIVGRDLWPLKKEVSLYSKVGTVLAQIISYIKQGNPMKELDSPSLLAFWLWQQDERGMGKLWTFIALLVSPQGWVNRWGGTCKKRMQCPNSMSMLAD